MIQVAEGKTGKKKFSVSRVSGCETPEGTVINGMIMDADGFVDFLKAYWKEQHFDTKDVILVSSSTKFVGQVIEMPVMNKRKTLQFIRREFAEIDRGEEKLYGYIRLAGAAEHMQRVYAESVSPDLIREYVEIFATAGIRLKGVYSGESSMINLIGQTVAGMYDHFVMQVAGSITLFTVLFTNGSYTYHSGVRCFYEKGTDDYASELTRSLGQLEQFMQAHQIGELPDHLIFAGMQPDKMPLYEQHFREAGITGEMELLKTPGSITGVPSETAQRYLFAVSGLADDQPYRNYKKLLQSQKAAGKELPVPKKSAVMVGTVAAVMAAGWITSVFYANHMQSKLQELQEENNSPLVQAQLLSYDELMDENSRLVAQYAALGEAHENLNTYPWLDSAIAQDIEACAEKYGMLVSITSYNGDTGTTNMTVTTKTDGASQIHEFVRELREMEEFYEVTYNGYSYQNDGTYSVDVSCILAEAAGRGNTQ
jgi:hypothetical protein